MSTYLLLKSYCALCSVHYVRLSQSYLFFPFPFLHRLTSAIDFPVLTFRPFSPLFGCVTGHLLPCFESPLKGHMLPCSECPVVQSPVPWPAALPVANWCVLSPPVKSQRIYSKESHKDFISCLQVELLLLLLCSFCTARVGKSHCSSTCSTAQECDGAVSPCAGWSHCSSTCSPA